MKKAIDKLKKAFKKNSEYKQAWIDGIAEAHRDAEELYVSKHDKRGRYLNHVDKHVINKEAGKLFLSRLIN